MMIVMIIIAVVIIFAVINRRSHIMLLLLLYRGVSSVSADRRDFSANGGISAPTARAIYKERPALGCVLRNIKESDCIYLYIECMLCCVR